MSAAAERQVLAFGEFYLDATQRLLFRANGERVALVGRAFDTLLFMVEHPAELLDKKTLMHAIWPDVIVEENNLSQNVFIVRRALGEAAGEHRFIVTVPGRGFRFVAPVRRLDANPRSGTPDELQRRESPPASTAFEQEAAAAGIDGAPTSTVGEQRDSARHFIDRPLASASVAISPSAAPKRSRWVPKTGLFVAAAVLTAASGLWLARGQFYSATLPKGTHVAVLPFDTLNSGEEARYLADGLTDQIVTILSNNQIPVVSRDDAAALRGPDRNKKLTEFGVALMFDGTVHNDGDKIDVNVHLEDPRQHSLLWSGQFDGAASGSTQLQQRIARSIVRLVSCSNRALRPVNGLKDPSALAHYLHACDIFANRDIFGPDAQAATLEMLGAFREVTVREPDFAAAHSDLAFLEAIEADAVSPEQAAGMRQEAASEAQRALALEPKSPDAYTAQAILLPPLQWAAREKLMRAGLATDPEWPRSNAFLASQLSESGRLTEATFYMRKATAADLQTDVSPDRAWLEAAAGGQTGPCIETVSRLVNVDGISSYWGELLSCQIWAGNWDTALATLAAAPSAPTAGTPLNDAWIAFVGAAKTRAPADIGRARKLALVTAAESGLAKWSAVLDLAYLGLLDDAFALAEQYTHYDNFTFDFLFLSDRRAAAQGRALHRTHRADRPGRLLDEERPLAGLLQRARPALRLSRRGRAVREKVTDAIQRLATLELHVVRRERTAVFKNLPTPLQRGAIAQRWDPPAPRQRQFCRLPALLQDGPSTPCSDVNTES